MFERIWEFFSGSETLLDDAWRSTGEMLVNCETMYEMVIQALSDEASDNVLTEVHGMDQCLNDDQREVRKMVFEHLATSNNVDIVHGLELTAIVIDLERIGDYTKNIGEIATMLPGPMEFGKYDEALDRVHEIVTRMFELTRQAVCLRSPEKGRAAMDLYPRVSRLCDRTMARVADLEEEGGQYDRSHLCLILLLRYLKRVSAHLKNVCSAIVNPFHQIGYRDGLP